MTAKIGGGAITYLELGWHGHRPIWVKCIASAFRTLRSEHHLHIWVPQQFWNEHAQWCRDLVGDTIRFRILENELGIRSEDVDSGPKVFKLASRCAAVDQSRVCFVANNLDAMVRSAALCRPGAIRAKLVGIMDAPSLHYRALTPPANQPYLSLSRFVKTYIINFLFLRRRHVGDVMMLDPLAPEFYNVACRTSKCFHVPEYVMTGSQKEENPRVALGLPEDRHIVLFAGPTDPRKGIHQLLDAFELLYRDNIDFRSRTMLVIAGLVVPNARKKVLSAVGRLRELAGADAVEIRDQMLTDAEFIRYIRASTVVAVPYLNFVGTSGILIQAAANGRPVIACQYGLVGELTTRHGLGLTCDPSDVNSLASTLPLAVQRGAMMTAADREKLQRAAATMAVPLEDFGAEVATVLDRAASRY